MDKTVMIRLINPLRKNPILSGLLIIEIIYAFILVISKPLIGWQNNWDFIRLSSCNGIWQAADGQTLRSAWPVPTSQFLYNEETAVNFCQPSSDLFFSNLIKLFINPGSFIDIALLGAIRLLFLVAILSFLFFYSRNRSFKLTIVITTFLAVCSYPFIAYLNSMYADATSLSFALVSILCLLLLLTEPHSRTIPIFLLMSMLTIGLGLSKIQYLPLATAILVVALISMFLMRFKLYSLIFASTIILLLTLSNMTTVARNMTDATNSANRADTILGAVLPEVNNPEVALEKLGLPQNCMKAIGSDWYTPGFQDLNPCPEISLVTSTAIIKLVPTEPSAMFNVFNKGISLSQPFFPEGRLLWAEPSQSSSFSIAQFATASSPVALLLQIISPDIWTSAIWISLLLFPIAGLAFLLIPKLRNKLGLLAPLLLIVSGVLTAYAIGTSVFGDGYIEVDKHSSLGIISIPLLIAGISIAVINSIKSSKYLDNIN